MSRLTLPEIAAAAARLETRPADELLAWALGEFGDRFAIVTSFQIEGMVVVDLARRLDPAVRVITLDTGRLPEETYEVIETVRVRVELVAPDPAAVAAMAAEYGPNPFRRDQALRRLCCQIRKVDPLGRPWPGWTPGRPGPAPGRCCPARTNGAVAGGGRPAPTRNAVCTTPAHRPASTGPWPSCGPTSLRAADPDRQP